MDKAGKEFVDKQKWLKTYKVKWTVPHFNDGHFRTTEHEAVITGRNILGVMGSIVVEFPKCKVENILSIEYYGTVKDVE